MTSSWQDLADDELRTRLVQRGAAERVADQAVENRDEPDTARAITTFLEGDSC